MKPYILICLIGMLEFSCGHKQEINSNTESSAFALERNSFFNSLTDHQLVSDNLIGLNEFDSKILNNPEDFLRYINSDVIIAANLGIYLSDLNYCILFNRKNEINEYFKAAYELSKAIRIENATLEFLMKRYEQNISQNDSVRKVMEEMLRQSTLGLKGTDRERLAGVAMAGYQIENLHLALATLEGFPAVVTEEQKQIQNQLQHYIVNQRGKFEVVYNFLRANSEPLDPDRNPNYPYFDNALRELITIYRSVPEVNPETKELHAKVTEIRNKLIDEE